MRSTAFTVSAMASVLSLAWFAAAVADLSGGVGDVWRHWWSALPAAVVAVSVVALGVAGHRRRSSSSVR